jgi:cytoskeletal protein CcmA (bactofilin family)
VAFRRDSKVDAFQRQISALRHQLGGEPDLDRDEPYDRSPLPRHLPDYRNDFPDFDTLEPEPLPPLRGAPVPEAVARDRAEPELPAIPSLDTETSVIAHSTAWKGNLESTGSLHVYGRVEGSLTAREDIFVAEEADVDAVIFAANVTIAGKVRGSIQCANRFEILPHGRVAADVRAPAIVIHDGALLVGEIAMTAADEPRSKLSAVPAARAAQGGD